MKISNFILALAIVSLPLSAKVIDCHEVHFDKHQMKVLKRAYKYGNKSDLGYTLAAIAWRESSAGKFLVHKEPGTNYLMTSYGVFHILLKTAYSREKCKTRECGDRLVQDLMLDFNYQAKSAVAELNYWMHKRGNNWSDTIAHYNSGNRISKRGRDYSDDVKYKVRWLQKCTNIAK